jgi:hypothetical protein
MSNLMDALAIPDATKRKGSAATDPQSKGQTADRIVEAAQIIGNLPSFVPGALRDLPAWLLWKYEQEPGDKKPRKVPYYAKGGRREGKQGNPEDRRHLVTFEAVKAAATSRTGFDGVGLALLPEFDLVALDFDGCVEGGNVHQDVEQLIAGTYAELSPSGRGVRAFMRGDLGDHKDHGAPFGFETFSRKGYVTFTGNRLDITDLLGCGDVVAGVSDAVRAFASARFGRKAAKALAEPDDPLMSHEPRLGLSPAQIDAALAVLDPDTGHDDWLHTGMGIHHETGGEGFEYWDTWSAKGGKYPGREVLERRWESFGNQAGRPVTARFLVKMANEHGAGIQLDVASPDDFEAVAEESGETDLRFRVVPAGEFSRGERPQWIIKGVLPRAELVVLFGESGSGKSFLALDLAAAIVRGVEWRGNRTKAGRVVYIAAEGGGGFRNRLQAYEQHYQVKLDEVPLGIIHATPNFLQKADAIDVAKAVVAFGKADVVIVDTFAQVIPGANENAAEDIGKALAHCRGIHNATGAVVVLVHHAGKDPSKGARGWSGLRAAADAEIEVVRTPVGRMLRVSKQKDGIDGREWGFDLEVVQIGMDEDGDVIDSCVVKEAEIPTTGRLDPKKRIGPWEKLVLDVVGEMALGQNAGIEVEAVIAEAVRRGPVAEDGKRDTRKQRARRALLSLCDGDDAPFFLEGDCLSVL